MKNKLFVGLLVFVTLFMLTGCGNSWKSKFEVSKIKIKDDYIIGKIRNKTDLAYDLKITFVLKSGSLIDNETCNLIIKPEETKDLDCLAMNHDDYDVNISNIEFTEKKIPKLSNGKINSDAFKYHFDKIYESHTYNFVSFTLVNDDFEDKYPYLDTIEYDEENNKIKITGSIMSNTDYMSFIETFNTKTNKLDNISFLIRTTDEELKSQLLTKISAMQSFGYGNSIEMLTALKYDIPEGKCYKVGYEWCVSSNIDKGTGYYFYNIDEQ